jgi:hypothetical protein
MRGSTVATAADVRGVVQTRGTRHGTAAGSHHLGCTSTTSETKTYTLKINWRLLLLLLTIIITVHILALFVYCLFNNAVSSSESDRTINLKEIGHGLI